MALMWNKSLQFVCFDEFVEKAKAQCLSRIVGDPFRKGVEQSLEFFKHYVLTKSIREHLKNLAWAIFIRRYPVLLQGPTSFDFALCRIDVGAIMCNISTVNLAYSILQSTFCFMLWNLRIRQILVILTWKEIFHEDMLQRTLKNSVINPNQYFLFKIQTDLEHPSDCDRSTRPLIRIDTTNMCIGVIWIKAWVLNFVEA